VNSTVVYSLIVLMCR